MRAYERGTADQLSSGLPLETDCFTGSQNNMKKSDIARPRVALRLLNHSDNNGKSKLSLFT